MRFSDRQVTESAQDGAVAIGLTRLFVAAIVFAIGLNGIVPLFPLYEMDFAMSTGDKTLVFGIYSICVIPGLPLFGSLADAYGRRLVLIGGFVGGVAAALVLASAGSLSDLIIGRAIQGVAAGAFWASLGAFARDLTPDSRRRDAMLLVSVAGPLGTAMGIALFGLVGSLSDSVVVPWMLQAALLAPTIVLVRTIPDRGVRSRSRPKFTIGVGSEARTTFVRYLVPVMLMSAVGTSFCLAIASDLIRSSSGSTSPLVGGLAASGMMLVSFLSQMFTRHTKRVSLLGVAGLASVVIGALALAASAGPDRPVAAIALGFVGVGFGFSFRAALVVAEHSSLPETRATTLSACVVVQYLGSGAGPIVSGFVADLTSTSAALYGIAAVTTFALVVSADHIRKMPSLDSETELIPA
jgi:predicted MFS family arabinose efflux permease